MSLSKEAPDSAAMLAAVRFETNQREEELRQDPYESLLFHADYISRHSSNIEHLDELREQFMEDKKQNSFSGRFEMALSPKYLGKIRVVELGTTTEVGVDGELDGLKDKYNNLKSWLIEMDVIEDEMTREECGRFYDIRRTHVTNDRLIIGRIRPLVSGAMEVEQADGETQRVQIDIAKRMVYSIPTNYLQLLAVRYGAETREDGKITLAELTRVLNGDNDLKDHLDSLLGHFEPIDGIRTSYYLHTQVIERN